jgi:hypothetical protein
MAPGRDREGRAMLAGAALAAGLLASPLAGADVYTWVDAKGNVNVGNLKPPEGARILGVTRENPAVKAQSDAAREAARQDEINTLTRRIAELENKAQAAFDAPPPVPYAPAPAYSPPAPAPQYNINVTVVPGQGPDYAAAFAPYGCAWAGCATWFPFAYPIAVIATTPHDVHRHRGGVRPPGFPSPPPGGMSRPPVDMSRPPVDTSRPPADMSPPPVPRMPVAMHAGAGRGSRI